MIYTLNGKTPQVHSSVYMAPGAKVIGDVILEENVSIWFNAVLRGDYEQITVGKGSNVQDGTVVHSDPRYAVKIGENITIGHNVIIHGCEIGNGSLIGMGAIIMNGAVIGEGSLIAAGTLIPEGKVIEPGVLVAGVPGRVVRKLTDEQIERLLVGPAGYVKNSRQYIKDNIVEK